MCHGRMPKPKSRLALVPDTLSPRIGSMSHVDQVQQSWGQFST